MRRDWNHKNFKMLLLILVISSIRPNFCQLALASSSYIGQSSFNSPLIAPALTKGFNVRDTRSKTLFTKYSDLKPVPRSNASAMESEIAAIFKEFAYGSSTSSSSTTVVPSTKSTTVFTPTAKTSTPNYFHSGVTEPKLFIGKQREVLTEIKISSDKSVTASPEKVSTTSAYSVLENNSAFTYLVNSNINKKSSTESLNNDVLKSDVDSNPPIDLDDNDLREVQVRVTSVLRRKGYEAIQQEIGRAWFFHVYVTGISFGIVAAVCLLSLSRINTCSQLLPRGYFITLHLMVFLASFLRCLLFLHDPYGAYERLPSVLTSLLFNSVDPCLTTAFSIVFLVLLRAARIRLVPLNMQSPLVLATVCGIHIGGSVVIDVSSGVLEDHKVISILNITTQAITAVWGSILCLGFVISFTSIEKAAQRQQGDLVRLTFNRKTVNDNSLNKNSAKPSLTYAARLFLICTLLHGLLIAFVILNLVTKKVPISATSSEAWAWWTQTSLERIVEIALCVLLLATALVLTQSKPRNAPKDKEEKIFSILSHCGRGTKVIKNMEVYPVANEKCNILGNGTLRRSSRNGSMTLTKNGWKHTNDPSVEQRTLKNQRVLNSIDADLQKPIQQDCPYNPTIMFSPLQMVHNNSKLRSGNQPNENYYGNFVKEANQKLSQEQAQYYTHLNNCSQTLPGSNYYCSQQPHVQKLEKPKTIKSNTIRGHHYPLQNPYDNAQITVYNLPSGPNQYISSPLQYNSKPENEYEVAPYYTHSNISSTSHVYTKPYSYYPSTNVHEVNPQRLVPHKYKAHRSYEIEPKSEISACSSSQSEIHVDYLTDVSSSNDGLSNTLSRSLTLPLYSHHCPAMIKDKLNGEINPDHTPDSAVGLDYSSQVEGDVTSPQAFNIKVNEANVNNPIGFLRLSTTSLNEVLKNQSVFLGKVVNGGNNNVNYSPLSLEDTISSPSTEYTVIRKSISTGDLTESKNSSTKSPHFSLSNAVNTNINNDAYRLSLHSQPVTCI